MRVRDARAVGGCQRPRVALGTEKRLRDPTCEGAELAARRARPHAPGLETDYEILMLAGRDGIGHIDVFPSDEQARRFYAERRKAIGGPVVLSQEKDLWALVQKIVTESVDDEAICDLVASAVGPTPQPQATSPKSACACLGQRGGEGSVAR